MAKPLRLRPGRYELSVGELHVEAGGLIWHWYIPDDIPLTVELGQRVTDEIRQLVDERDPDES